MKKLIFVLLSFIILTITVGLAIPKLGSEYKQDHQLTVKEVNMLVGYNLEMARTVSKMYDYNIPISIAMATAILESKWGTSRGATQYYSLFGIKADKRWKGKHGFNRDGKCRRYACWAESYLDYGLFLNSNQRYKVCLDIPKTGSFQKRSHKFAECLERVGYCRVDNYSGKLKKIIDKYGLYNYDKY